jgi:hypothetical protein
MEKQRLEASEISACTGHETWDGASESQFTSSPSFGRVEEFPFRSEGKREGMR